YYYSKIGFKKSKNIKNIVFENYFRLMTGVIEYNKKKYVSSIDSIKKALVIIKSRNDFANIAYGNHYLGLSNHKLKKPNYIEYFKKVDSIFQITNDLHPDLRSSYEYIIDYYREKKELNKELEFVKKLITLDKVIYDNYNSVGLSLVKKYDTPVLLQEKNEIINSLKANSSTNKYYLIFICLTSFILFILVFYQNKKKKIYKKKFEEIIRSTPTSTPTSTKEKLINIPNNIIEDVLNGLVLFEDNKKFISNRITLSSLAKDLKTNTNYLSKIINHHRNNSFSNYINHLRINYIVEKLKIDKTIRKYTIKAISEEVGFNNSESFSKAFYKIKGIKPSYFIKELNKID
uniref:helix-turn-helix domain-containing protein n=1 Tax=Tenacibaculum ovolyticum TaxID=104270 RepID=UPI000A484A06